MKKYYTLLLLALPLMGSAQLKQIAFAELTSGSNMWFGAEMSTTTITVTVQGPSDRFIAFGFGTGMANGNDALIWSTLGTGAAPLQIRDHRMVGQGVEPTVDAQQDWTEISNVVSGGNRTIVASRALSTGDANDVTFNFAATTQNLFWSKGPSATNQLQYHGSGNRASGIVRNWVLVDQTPPLVNTFTPVDNASGVSLTQNLSLNFNENISWGTGSITLFDGTNTVIQTISNGSPGVGVVGATLNWNPTANFVLNTNYYVHIDATALKDAAGNFFAGIADNVTWNFNTNDITAPTLVAGSFIPADNAVEVPLTQSLSFTLNEAVQAGTGMIELYDAIAATVIESFDVASSPLITITGANVSINPTADFILNTSYYIHIPSGVIKDLAGNNYAGFTNNTTWNFNTNDVTAPLANGPFVLVDDATNVGLTGQYSVTFTEDVMLASSGTIQLYKNSGPYVLVETYDQNSPLLQVNGSTITILTSTGLFEENTYYHVEIDASFVRDLSNNAFAGIGNAAVWNFTTGDFTAPTLAATNVFSPTDNATNVPVATILSIHFSEDVVPGTGSFFLVNESNASSEEFSSGTGDITISGNTVTLTPAVDLDGLTNYHVVADLDAVKDAGGNSFAGISNPTVWNFETESGAGLDELAQEGISWNGSVLSFTGSNVPVASLYDASGKLVLKNLKQTTDCSALTSGIYLVSIQRESGLKTVRLYVD